MDGFIYFSFNLTFNFQDIDTNYQLTMRGFVFPFSFAITFGAANGFCAVSSSLSCCYTKNRLSASNLPATGEAADPALLTDILLAGLSKVDQVMSPTYLNQNDKLKQLNSQIVKNVEVKESSIPDAGLGLFATKNIKACLSLLTVFDFSCATIEYSFFFCVLIHFRPERL
jgi:hypothetical protein